MWSRVPCTPTERLPGQAPGPFHMAAAHLQCLVMRPGALSLPTKPHSEATWLLRALHTPRS